MKRRHFILLIVIVIASATYLWSRPTPPRMDPTQIRTVRLKMFDFSSSYDAVDVSTSDPNVIKQLTSQLIDAERASEHRCATRGTLTFAGSQNVEIGLLPGHDPKFFEFRTRDGIFRVPRDAFVQTLTDFGVPAKRFINPDQREPVDAID